MAARNRHCHIAPTGRSVQIMGTDCKHTHMGTHRNMDLYTLSHMHTHIDSSIQTSKHTHTHSHTRSRAVVLACTCCTRYMFLITLSAETAGSNPPTHSTYANPTYWPELYLGQRYVCFAVLGSIHTHTHSHAHKHTHTKGKAHPSN